MKKMFKKKSVQAPSPEDDDISDIHDPVIKMTDPLLEVIIPADEATVFAALRYNDTDMVERLLRGGFDVNYRQGHQTEAGEPYRLKSISMAHRIHTTNYAPLHIAVLHSQYQLIKLLLENGADVDIRDNQERTPLHFAVVANRISVIQLLIKTGANLDAQSSSGRTPLLEATMNGSFDCAETLVAAGANVDLLDLKGTSVLHFLCFNRTTNMDLLRSVIKAGCNINITNFKGATPFMFATNLKKLDVMKVLLASGANINQRDYSGCTALHFLAGSKSSGRERIIPFLLHNGADIHMPDKKGISMLQKAVKIPAIQAMKIFLSADAPRNGCENMMEQPQIIKVCEYVPEFRDWLLQELYTPKTLMRYCRGTIRSLLSPDRLCKLNELDLPQYLQDFLLARDIVAE